MTRSAYWLSGLLLTGLMLAGPQSRAQPSDLSLSEPQSPASDSSNYLDAIARLEQLHGPYHNDLAQHLLGLGVDYQQRGQHTDAAGIFLRAMHISRVNEGLYSLNQVPLLERLIESSLASGDWQAAGEQHEYLYWLHRRNYEAGDLRLLPILNRLGNWHLHAYRRDDTGNSDPAQHLLSAHQYYSQAAQMVELNYGPTDLRLVEALQGLIATNYYLAIYQQAVSRRNQIEAGFGSSGFGSNSAAMDERARLDQYILNSYRSGKQAIEHIQRIYTDNPDAPAHGHIQAQVELADWNLLFSRWNTALALYRQAYQALQTAEMSELSATLFERPVALPNLPLLKSPEAPDQPQDKDPDAEFVLVSFDVTYTGATGNIEILDSRPEDATRNRAHVRRLLQAARFRPRFVEGEPVDTPQILHRFVFSN